MGYSGPAWDQGRAGEAAIKRWLQQQGFFVLPAADIANGGAPMLEGLHSRAVLPDFLAAIGGASRLVEVATKGHPTFYKKTQKMEHGKKASQFWDYMACQEQTGIPCYLCVWELETRLVLLQLIDKLATVARRYDGPNMPDHQPHVFFPRDAFDWYEGPDVIPFTPIVAASPRTLAQKPAVAHRQLGMEF